MAERHALIIEDDVDIAELYNHALGLIGFSSETIRDKEHALERLRQDAPSLVLLDLQLGNEVAGPELLALIRSEERYKDVPVIVISGHSRVAEELFNQADFVLLKPVDLRQLVGLVVRLQSDGIRTIPPYGSMLIELESFLERLSFNLMRSRSRTRHLFPVYVISIVPVNPEKLAQMPGQPTEKLATEIGKRILRRTRSADSSTRLRENEYAIMLYEITEQNDSFIVGERLLKALEEPFEINGDSILMQVHIGIALNTKQTGEAKDMLISAQAALDKVIRSDQKIMLYTPEGREGVKNDV